MAGRATFAVFFLLAACAGAPPTAEPAPTSAAPTQTTTEPDAPAPPDAPGSEKGTKELVRELRELDALANGGERFQKKAQIIGAIRLLADPRGADALDEYANRAQPSVSKGEHTHFKTLVGFALAELGDVRAIPILAERLSLDTLNLYDDSDAELPLKRDDQERVISARLLADLGELHPDISADARATAARGLATWLADRPEPHANALRARARLHIDDAATQKELVDWADPKTPLPKKSAQPPFPSEFVIAQSALRWLGASKHPKAADILKKQLHRRPKGFDGRMDGLLLQGSAILGMTLRALASGAAEGLSELGDARAASSLLAYIDDDLENEQSRTDACQALAWLVTDAESNLLSKRLKAWSKKRTKDDEFRVSCLVDGLVLRTTDPLVPFLLALVTDPQTDPLLAAHAAKALGRHGLDQTTESALRSQLDGTREVEAAVAIALGGSPDAIAQLAKHASSAKGSWLPTVSAAYAEAVHTIYADDLSSGRFLRWVENASALAAAKVQFAAVALREQALASEFDSGPRSLTRVVLRGRLRALAEPGGPEQKRAIQALELLGERGVLLALAEKTALTPMLPH